MGEMGSDMASFLSVSGDGRGSWCVSALAMSQRAMEGAATARPDGDTCGVGSATAGATSQRKLGMAEGLCSATLQLAPAGMSVTVVVCVPGALKASADTA